MIAKRDLSFPLGQVVGTPGALTALADSKQGAVEFLSRHQRGDWGEVDQEDKEANDRAVVEGSRLLSAYSTNRGVRFWIITEADRSSTCLLLPEEY